jgi:hypothetical protein
MSGMDCVTAGLGADELSIDMLGEDDLELRDQFAVNAMLVLDADRLYVHGGEDRWAHFAAACYELADAMLRARSE